MSKYTEILEFFMENNIRLDKDQMNNLKNICNEGLLLEGDIISLLNAAKKKSEKAAAEFAKNPTDENKKIWDKYLKDQKNK